MTALATPVRSSLRWLPLAGVALLLAASAVTGSSSFSPLARAANTVTVTGLVTEYVYLDATGCTAPTALNIGDVVPNDPWKRTTSDCAVLFGTSNSALGADLNVLEDAGAPPAPLDAMKCITPASCTGGSYDGTLNDVASNSSPPAGSTSAFGAQLESASGLATSSWTAGMANPVAASSTACQTAAVGDGTCAFRFGASASGTDGPGAYRAEVQFIVIAR